MECKTSVRIYYKSGKEVGSGWYVSTPFYRLS